MYEIRIALYTIIVFTLITNLYRVFKETRQLKAEGKQPLTHVNVPTVILAAVGEFLVVWAVLWLHAEIGEPKNWFSVAGIFASGYIMKDVGAYLVAWLTWAIYVKIEQRKAKKQLEEDERSAF